MSGETLNQNPPASALENPDEKAPIGGVVVNEANPLLSRFEGPSPAYQVGIDMVKRGAIIAPVAVLIGTLIWGSHAWASVLAGLILVLVNIWLSAYIINVTAKISFVALAGGAMFGFLMRLGIITAVVLILRNFAWVDLVALCITIVISHLGLLFWELRYISASLAYPGLKPTNGAVSTSHKESVSS